MTADKQNFWRGLARPFTVLAPMEDVTDTVFRRIVAGCGRPDVFFSEFTSADGLFSRGRESVIHRLQFTESERPIVAQIWGSQPENIRRSAELLKEMGFDGIDINMGCPVAKIIKKGACAALIDNPELARDIFLAARAGAGGLPVSIKTRLGFRRWQTETWAEFLLQLEPAALTVHGRIAKHLSKYPARWDEIAKVVRLRNEAKSSTLIIGNGDVASFSDGVQKHENSGVDGLMIGRGVFENLCIFQRDPGARSFSEFSEEERLALMLRHARLFVETWTTQRSFQTLKKFTKVYAASFRNAAELRVKLVEECHSLEDMEKIVGEWLAERSSCQS